MEIKMKENSRLELQRNFWKKLTAAIFLSMLLSLMFKVSPLAAGITPTPLNDFESSKTNVTSYDIELPAGVASKVQQIQMSSSGRLEIYMYSSGLPSMVTVELYSNSGCTDKVGCSASIYSNGLTNTMKADIPSAGTYYLKMYRTSYSSSSAAKFSIQPYSYNGEEKTLKPGVWSGTYGPDYDKTVYHKIVISKPGYITLQGYAQGSTSTPKYNISVGLNDASKKSLYGVYLNSSKGFTTYFGVKKGTYYISAKQYGNYKLKYTFTAVSEKSGSSKSKAVTLRKKKAAKGLLIAGESANKSDWYKIKLTKKQKLSFAITGKSSSYFRVKVIPKKSRLNISNSFFAVDNGSYTWKTDKKVPAGTYYIQISRYSGSLNSGYYSLKWK